MNRIERVVVDECVGQYFAKKMLTYLEASRQRRYIHERWPVSKRVNSSRSSGDDSTLIERS